LGYFSSTYFVFILVILCVVLVYKPVKKYFQKRNEKFDNDIIESEKNKKEAEINNLNSQKNLANSKNEALNIKENAKIEANKEHDRIIEEANNEADNIIKKANEDAINIKNNAKKEIKNEIVDTAILASKEILSREINEEDNKKIIDDFVDELNEKK